MKIKRLKQSLKNDMRRVILRPFHPTTEERTIKIINRILALSEKEVQDQLEKVLTGFESRHRNLQAFYLQRMKDLQKYIDPDRHLSPGRRLLIGAYFTLEYSIEASSLFNPSMVWHPDQFGLPDGSRRFILSLRATGEGHVSSLVFRSGEVDAKFRIKFDPSSRYAGTTEAKLNDRGYQAVFSRDYPLSERVLFPAIPEESNGIEDARLVAFQQENGSRTYYASYTAYDGRGIHSMLLQTDDFITFNMGKLQGPAIANKGLALFPRKINGKYVMLSRQDNENNYLMVSDNLYDWAEKKRIMEPAYPWDFFQIGNCGCPLETPDGWVVLAHGVGAMRRYVVSAFLLDLNDPSKVIGRLPAPLLEPNEQEREGYVPNVVYSCGGQLFGQHLIFPYAMSDYASSFAVVKLSDLLRQMR